MSSSKTRRGALGLLLLIIPNHHHHHCLRITSLPLRSLWHFSKTAIRYSHTHSRCPCARTPHGLLESTWSPPASPLSPRTTTPHEIRSMSPKAGLNQSMNPSFLLSLCARSPSLLTWADFASQGGHASQGTSQKGSTPVSSSRSRTISLSSSPTLRSSRAT